MVLLAVLATEQDNFQIKSITELKAVLNSLKSAVILDIETTGFSLEKFADIIEIGAVKLDVERRKVTDIYNQFIRPATATSIPAKISELTRITWKDVANQPYIEEVLPKFYDFIGDLPVVIHNAKFDWVRFLLPAFEMVGLHASNEAICSMMLAKELYPGRGRAGYNLASLCEMYGSKIEGHHRAYVDCKWTASLFLRLLDRYREIHKSDNQNMFNSNTNSVCQTKHIRQVDFSKMRVNRVNGSLSSSKKIGARIYVYTNFGRLHYSVLKHLWTVDELWTDKNAPVQLWGEAVLKSLDMDVEAFTKKFIS